MAGEHSVVAETEGTYINFFIESQVAIKAIAGFVGIDWNKIADNLARCKVNFFCSNLDVRVPLSSLNGVVDSIALEVCGLEEHQTCRVP